MCFKFGYNLSFNDLYQDLDKVDNFFMTYLQEKNENLYIKLKNLKPFNLTKKEENNLLINIAPYIENFISKVFYIESNVEKLHKKHKEFKPIFQFKRDFIQRKASNSEICKDPEQTREKLIKILGEFSEINLAYKIIDWIEKDEKEKISLALSYAAWAVKTDEGKKYHKDGFLFKLPQKIDHKNLIPVINEKNKITINCEDLYFRDGFSHSDKGLSFEQSLNQTYYCLYCHNRDKDSCSKGFKDIKSNELIINDSGIKLEGCALEEKISEALTLKKQGYVIGALATIIIDNPMVAATGHRICNDCSKACIYQKQESVDIPSIESSILNQVLELPYGFEIYSLLTRWNPLNFKRITPKKDTGHNILVVGMGPAGFTLSHHLMNDGHNVVGVDGLKIEPLSNELLKEPIKNIKDIYEDLSDRTIGGFGGVAEYGITVRWNKNYLKIIRLLLQRRKQFLLFDGIRFGGTITPKQALKMGFDHIALCTGSGKPTIIKMKNGLSNGVRQASDFLMSLQLTGAAKKDSIANLQLRLPVIVIGGGLTAIDTATEALAYYPVQVETFLSRYEKLVALHGKDHVEQNWSKEDSIISIEFIKHAKELRLEKQKSKEQNTGVNFLPLLRKWGGVSVVYRKKLQESPAYKLNHEEVHKAMEEGILFYEEASPEEIIVDEFGHAKSLKLISNKKSNELDAKSILIAAGTKPNITLAKEFSNNIYVDGNFFQAVDENGDIRIPENSPKPKKNYILLNQNFEKNSFSFFGDRSFIS